MGRHHSGDSAFGADRREILRPAYDEHWEAELGRIERAIGYAFKDRRLLERALTHRSYGPEHYERLEFLGDSILNCGVARMLFSEFKKLPEGSLSQARANLVNQDTLADVAERLGVGKALRIGNGEARNGGFEKPSILSDCVESIIAAVSLDAGLGEAMALIERLYEGRIDSLDGSGGFAKNPKSRLQELLQAKRIDLPEYRCDSVKGVSPNQVFAVSCSIPALGLKTVAKGASKKLAEIACAENALAQIERPEIRRILDGME